MKPNELRVGNLVKNQYDEKAIVIRGYDINDLCEGMDSEVFQPIKITENWLLKFKFDNNHWATKWILENMPIPTGIEYVHQLQNLYFALTGTELAFENEIK